RHLGNLDRPLQQEARMRELQLEWKLGSGPPGPVSSVTDATKLVVVERLQRSGDPRNALLIRSRCQTRRACLDIRKAKCLGRPDRRSGNQGGNEEEERKLHLSRKKLRCLSEIGSFARSITWSKSSQMARF